MLPKNIDAAWDSQSDGISHMPVQFPVKNQSSAVTILATLANEPTLRTYPRLPPSSVFYQGLRSNRICYSLVLPHLCLPEARWINPKTTITSYCSTCTLYGHKTLIQRLQHLVELPSIPAKNHSIARMRKDFLQNSEQLLCPNTWWYGVLVLLVTCVVFSFHIFDLFR